MNNPRSIRLHYMIRAVLLLAFALYIGRLVQQDALHYYVAPKLARWIRLCPIPLALMSLSLAVQALLGRARALCDCEHKLPRSLPGGAALYGLFLLPLLLGFLLPDRALGTAAAARKGMALSYVSPETGAGRSIAEEPYQREFTALATRLHALPVISVYPQVFSETFGAIDLYKNDFDGKEIILSGFLYKDPNADESAYAVGRFLVQCCTADATPLGIRIDPGTQISLPADTWIEVRGKLHVVPYGGGEILQITPERLTPLEAPETPYVYASGNSVAAWEELRTAVRLR